MRISTSVTWDATVLPCWQRSANGALRPNSDVWRDLPEGIRWFEAEVEERDVGQLDLLGSPDLRATFGSYRVVEIAGNSEGGDPHSHRTRVRGILTALRAGRTLERPILVAESAEGPFVVIDGNHRCLAYHCERRLAGLAVYLGMADGLFRMFPWAREAVRASPWAGRLNDPCR